MIIKSTKLSYVLCLLFCVYIGLYTYFYGNNENHIVQSSRITQLQPEGEKSESNSSIKSKNTTLIKVMNENNVSSFGKANMSSEITDTSANDVGNLKLDYQANRRNINIVNSEGNEKENDNCKWKTVALSQTQLPITGLVSFPGSGNTWTRHLIQQMTGLGTSSMFCDWKLRKSGFPYECEQDKTKTVVAKTHFSRHLKLFTKVVLLIRNPYDALLSYANFLKAGHTGHPSNNILITESNKVFEDSLQWYINLTRDTTILFKGPVHIIQYENLQTNMAGELKKLSAFLGLNTSDRDIECTVKLQEGHFHRLTDKKKHIELLRVVYSNEKISRLHQAVRYCEKMIKDAYDTDIDIGGYTKKRLLNSL